MIINDILMVEGAIESPLSEAINAPLDVVLNLSKLLAKVLMPWAGRFLVD